MTLRVLLAIPTFDNPQAIEKVVKDTLLSTELSVLVIDDGSKIPVAELLLAQVCRDALSSGRLQIVRHEVNRGKGAAIQTAFVYGVENGFTHALTIDGDGQHVASDVDRLLAVACESPWDLIIGKRKMSGENVPSSSQFGRKFSNFWVGFETGNHVHDSQSGFRLYPLFHVQGKKFFTRRYDFEIEILIRLMWAGVRVREVEVDVHYPPATERVSHFDKFHDNVRISVLNVFLVAVSLLSGHRSPVKSGVAFGVGVFCGCTPLYGLHTLLIAAISLVFRLNAVLLFVGSNISFAPIAVVLIPLQVVTGREILRWFGHKVAVWQLPDSGLKATFEFAGHHLLEWVIGSTVTGVVFGVILGTLVTLIAKKLSHAGQANWTGRTRGGRLGNGFLIWVLENYGRHLAYAFLYFVVPYFYVFAPTARRGAHEYWRAIEPEARYFERVRFIFLQMYRFGQTLLDRAYQNLHSEICFVPVAHGIEEISRPILQNRAVILLSAHVGSWELAARFLRLGHGNTKSIEHLKTVEYEADGLTFDKAIGAKESREFFARGAVDILQIKQQIEDSQPIALMGDRPSGGQIELVKFARRLLPVDSTPLRIASACRCLTVYTFGFKGAENEYEFFAEPGQILEYRDDVPRPVQLRCWAQDYADSLARQLSNHPEQWFNFFPIFSRPPQEIRQQMTADSGSLKDRKERNYLWREWQKPATPVSGSVPVAKASDV